MGQVLLFLAAVNSVPWALYFLLREPAAGGKVWGLFAWLLQFTITDLRVCYESRKDARCVLSKRCLSGQRVPL